MFRGTNLKPPFVALMLPLESIKFFALYENVVSNILVDVLVNLYSINPSGKLELSSSVGMKGLQPVILTTRGISLSFNWMVEKGNLA